MPDPLRVYLLLDVSASMTGAPLEALKQGVHLLIGTLTTRSNRPIKVCVISYESTAREIVPLSEVKTGLDLPELISGGSSGLGGALRLLAQKMPDHQPIFLYLFTDGDPTDDWEEAIIPVRQRVGKIIGMACGFSPDMTTLKKIAQETFLLRDLTSDMLFTTFRLYV